MTLTCVRVAFELALDQSCVRIERDTCFRVRVEGTSEWLGSCLRDDADDAMHFVGYL